MSNESSETLRMFNNAFDGLGAAPGNYTPASHLDEIDAVNARVYATVNNGVYQARFAKTQGAYETAVTALFDTLDWLEARLTHQRYLVGGMLTEAEPRVAWLTNPARSLWPCFCHILLRAMRSASIMVGKPVATDGTSGQIDAWTTRNPAIPRTRPWLSTTAVGSPSTPIGTVEVGCW